MLPLFAAVGYQWKQSFVGLVLFLQTNGGMSRCLHFCPCFWCAGTKIPFLVSTLFLKWLFKALPGEWTGNKLLAEPSYFSRRLVRRGLFWYSICWRHLLMILTIQNTERYSNGWRRTGFGSIAPASSFYFRSLSKCLPGGRCQSDQPIIWQSCFKQPALSAGKRSHAKDSWTFFIVVQMHLRGIFYCGQQRTKKLFPFPTSVSVFGANKNRLARIIQDNCLAIHDGILLY